MVTKKSKKRSRGRPKFPPGKGKEVTVRLRMTEAMRDALRKRAEVKGIAMSKLIRDLLANELDE